MKDQIRVGMIGTSWYADLMHLPLLKSHPKALVAAICGRNRARAEEMASKFGIPQVFTDYRDMIDHGQLDAVVIAVPDDMHYPIAMAALDAGLHVLGEKPLAFDLHQAQAMLAKAESAGVKHMTCFTWRWLPQIRFMLQLVNEGFLGKPFHAHFNYIANYARKPDYHWKWDRRHGLGILGDLGSHMIDQARLMLGEIDKVHAHIATHVERPHPQGESYEPAGDSAMLTLLFKNGAQGSIHVSAVAHVEEKRARLVGQDGALDVDFSWGSPFTLRSIREGQEAFQTQVVPEQYLEGINLEASYYEQLVQMFTNQSIGTRLFIDCIVEDKPIASNFHEGMKAQAVIEAAFESNTSGCWVDVPAAT